MNGIHLSWGDHDLASALDQLAEDRLVAFFGPVAWCWLLAEPLASLRAASRTTAIVGAHVPELVRGLTDAGMLVIVPNATTQLLDLVDSVCVVIVRPPQFLLAFRHEEAGPGDLHLDRDDPRLAVVDLSLLDAGKLTADVHAKRGDLRNVWTRVIGRPPEIDAAEEALLAAIQGQADGKRLPLREVAAMLGVSKHMARQALRRLSERGHVAGASRTPWVVGSTPAPRPVEVDARPMLQVLIGEMTAGDRLAPHRELAEALGVGPHRVMVEERRLRRQGCLGVVRQQGRRRFVVIGADGWSAWPSGRQIALAIATAAEPLVTTDEVLEQAADEFARLLAGTIASPDARPDPRWIVHPRASDVPDAVISIARATWEASDGAREPFGSARLVRVRGAGRPATAVVLPFRDEATFVVLWAGRRRSIPAWVQQEAARLTTLAERLRA